MLVEINLLPKKEPKNIALLFWGGIIIIAMVIFLIVFYFTLQDAKQELKNTNQKIQLVESAQAAEQAKQESDASTKNLKNLQSVVKWANKQPVKTVPILDQLTKLLPKYGYIHDFSCTENRAEVTVQFYTDDEATYYLNRLNDSHYFNSAILTSIKTQDLENDTASDSASTESSASTAKINTATNTNSDSTSNTNDSTNSGSTSSSASVSNSNATTSVTSTAAGTDSADVLPVFLASYTIQLNKDAINAAAKEGENK